MKRSHLFEEEWMKHLFLTFLGQPFHWRTNRNKKAPSLLLHVTNDPKSNIYFQWQRFFSALISLTVPMNPISCWQWWWCYATDCVYKRNNMSPLPPTVRKWSPVSQIWELPSCASDMVWRHYETTQLGLGGEAVGLSSCPYTQPIQLQAELAANHPFFKIHITHFKM